GRAVMLLDTPNGDPGLVVTSPEVPVQRLLTLQQQQSDLENSVGGRQRAGTGSTQVALSNQMRVPTAEVPATFLEQEAGGQSWMSPHPGRWLGLQGKATGTLEQLFAAHAAKPQDESFLYDPFVP